MSIFHRFLTGLQDAAYIWREEMKQVFKDEGVLIFFIIVPLVYPLLYSWIYNNEVVHEVPVVVVDHSHSGLSRELIRKLDASADVKIFCHAADMDEARSLVSRQLVKGIYYIPSDFATRLNRMEQATLSVYCDMSLMLSYKAIYQTAVNVTQYMGAEIQKKLSGKYTVTDAPARLSGCAYVQPSGWLWHVCHSCRAHAYLPADVGAWHWSWRRYSARKESLWRPCAHPSCLWWHLPHRVWQGLVL